VDFLEFVELENVAVGDPLEPVNADTALQPGLDLARVILEPLETEQLAFARLCTGT